MKFSVFSVCMPEYDVRQTVSILKELGFDGVEWRVASPPPAEKPTDYRFESRYWTYNLSTVDVDRLEQDADEIKGICDSAGLEIPSLGTYLNLWDINGVERALKAARTLGCRNIRVIAPVYNGSENYRSLFGKASAQVRVLEKLAEKHDARVNFEIHMGNIIPSASAAYRLVAGTNPRHVGIIFDPGNMAHEGFENYKLGLELLGEYLSHVHIKNGAWIVAETSEDGVEVWKPCWVPLKKGIVDIKNLIGVLKDLKYAGYLAIEDFSNEEDTYSKLKGDLKYLKEIAGIKGI